MEEYKVDRQQLFPSPGLAARWRELLTEIRCEKDLKRRGNLSLAVYQWLRGLATATSMSAADFSSLQAVLLDARHRSCIN